MLSFVTSDLTSLSSVVMQPLCVQYLTGGFNEKAVTYQVTNGKNAMPAFGGRLSDDGVNILKSLRSCVLLHFVKKLNCEFQSDIANVATYVISTSEAGWD